jgi:hypothetical protein
MNKLCFIIKKVFFPIEIAIVAKWQFSHQTEKCDMNFTKHANFSVHNILNAKKRPKSQKIPGKVFVYLFGFWFCFSRMITRLRWKHQTA